MFRMMVALAAACVAACGVAAPAQAQEERGSSFFCMAEDSDSNTYLHSGTFRADPAVSKESYDASWRAYLSAKGLPTKGGCTFTDLPDNVPAYLEGMKQQCDTCSVWSLRSVDWTFAAAPTKKKDHHNLASEICEGFDTENYRERALAEGPDAQLRSLCGQAFEYFTMYERALKQGYSEADAERTYEAHEKTAAVLKQFYEETRTDR